MRPVPEFIGGGGYPVRHEPYFVTIPLSEWEDMTDELKRLREWTRMLNLPYFQMAVFDRSGVRVGGSACRKEDRSRSVSGGNTVRATKRATEWRKA